MHIAGQMSQVLTLVRGHPNLTAATDTSLACRKELAEAQRTNKPCGKCHFFLLISKTYVDAGKDGSIRKPRGQGTEELRFANAEEEFFYEVHVCPVF